jgi:CBS domain containing-hemolysin-like protein
MGIVLYEFVGTSGIGTLEDVMEEVIGEIKDEFDFEDEVEFKQLGANVFVFEGKTMLNDMCRIISIDTNSFDKVRGDADSIAGLILEIAEKIPKKGQEFNYQEFQFKIMSVTKRRIERIRITVDR